MTPRAAAASAGLIFLMGMAVGLSLRSRPAPAQAVLASSLPLPELPAFTAGPGGIAPGAKPGETPDVIVPLTASHPASLVVPPDEEPEVIRFDRVQREHLAEAPLTNAGVPAILGSSGEIHALNVRDAAALVMGPGGREQGWPAGKPARKAKEWTQEPEAANVPDAVRGRFR